MSSEHILAVVKKHLMEVVEGLSEEQIEPAKSMKDLGANSLDIVEVVAATMRELKVRIPRSELSRLTNIGGLVDLLARAASPVEGQPPGAAAGEPMAST